MYWKTSITDLIEVLSKKISNKCDIFLCHLKGKKKVRKAKHKKYISVSTEQKFYRLQKHSTLSLCSQGKCSSLQPAWECSAELIPRQELLPLTSWPCSHYYSPGHPCPPLSGHTAGSCSAYTSDSFIISAELTSSQPHGL